MKKSMNKDLRKLMRLYRSIMRQKGGGNAKLPNTETSVNNQEENVLQQIIRIVRSPKNASLFIVFMFPRKHI